tara:strand:+ start:999 stop:1862 length:864 start_codon:yes stop_codon:yes gene_type:complete
MVLPIVLGTIAQGDADGSDTPVVVTGGTKMYLMDALGDDNVYEYTLSTAWDLSTASYTAVYENTDADTGDGLPREFAITHDGLHGYIVGNSQDHIDRFTLGTAWDITTLNHQEDLDISGKEFHPYGLEIKGDGTSVYVIGYSSDKIHQWNMSTANDLSTASYHGYLSTSSQSNAAGGLGFSKNGTKVYVADQLGDDIHEYTLSTAWDITTGSHINTLDVSAKEATVNGCAISSTGVELYIFGSTSDSVHQYTLSTAYDISTASFTHTLDVSGKSTFGQSVCFNMEDV